MTVKIISRLVKICSLIVFPMCFEVKNSMIFAEIFSEQISTILIIPKLSSKLALTVANAPFTICAESKAALTGFILHQRTHKNLFYKLVMFAYCVFILLSCFYLPLPTPQTL
ncbi:MAG: hypothetical protein ACI3X6_03140 [Alloprevotella sp.]